ncbi:LIV-I protein H [Variovorax sp. SRS16]|uniref:branched-chain amino acid ABC transporter permease n=1 Tax=Variovorax sp. SRS16 TaxID=282217 RepID=UPI0013175EA3|nr:branched-chain amino acid ABC transporter permease [Variovorax sp. SRS16]VTU14449.1 LIV-I protein H [Variovorax sp. SRS16]
MEGLLHQIISGIAMGGVYGALGLAAVIVYQSTHHLNFAQGEMAMFSTYIAWMLMQAGLPAWAALGLTLVAAFATGMLIQRFVIHRARFAPALTTVLLFIALLVIFNSLAGWLFGYSARIFPSPFGSGRAFDSALISVHELGSIAVTLVLVAALYLFFNFTKLGLAMQATAHNPMSARLVGIRVGWMLAFGWGLAAAIGAVAGVLVAPVVYLDPSMMSGVLIYGFAAALLGGLDSPWGAIAGGVIVGVLENVLGAYVIGTELKLSVALMLIIGVLLFRPSGLFGTPVVTRV